MEERSQAEKEMIAMIQDPAEPLPFKIRRIKTMYNEETVMEDLVYSIPEEKKAELLEQLWPFTPTPKMDDVFFDIHENACFTMKDFKVIRWKQRNIIVSPFYLKSGGTCIDMITPDAAEGACFISNIRNRKN